MAVRRNLELDFGRFRGKTLEQIALGNDGSGYTSYPYIRFLLNPMEKYRRALEKTSFSLPDFQHTLIYLHDLLNNYPSGLECRECDKEATHLAVRGGSDGYSMDPKENYCKEHAANIAMHDPKVMSLPIAYDSISRMKYKRDQTLLRDRLAAVIGYSGRNTKANAGKFFDKLEKMPYAQIYKPDQVPEEQPEPKEPEQLSLF